MSTSLKVIIADTQRKQRLDYSTITESATWSTTMADQPGKCVITTIAPKQVDVSRGSALELTVNGVRVFRGYVFSVSKSRDTASITAYDKTRYLTSADAIIFPKSTTLKSLIKKINTATKLGISVPSGGGTRIGRRVFENQSYYQMIRWAIDQTLAKGKKLYALRDENGKLYVRDCSKLMTDWVIGDASLLTGYEYEASIDSGTYTTVKLIRDKTKKKKTTRATVVKTNSAAVKKWGRLQYFEKIDDGTKDAAMKKMAKDLLALYSRETHTLRLEAVSIPSLRAGDGIGVRISDLDTEGLAKVKACFIQSIEHRVQGSAEATMTLEVSIA